MRTKRVLRKIAALATGVGMLGATMTGALAVGTTLADYPSPFITSGVFSGLIVVGSKAAASDTIGSSTILSDLQTKAVTKVSTSGSISVSGGVSDQIPLGESIAPAKYIGNSSVFDQQLEDDDINSMQDTIVNFQSSDYDVRDMLILGQNSKYITVATSLANADDDYNTDVFLEVDKDSIKYYYVFDETIQPNLSTSSNSLKVKFLGKTLKIVSVSADRDDKFTAYVGEEHFLTVGQTATVEGKVVTLKNVGSGGDIMIDVDGVVDTLSSSTTQTINGLEVTNDKTFYDSNNAAERSANLIVGKDSQASYVDGDAYVGENTDNPNWVWNINNLNSKASTTVSTAAEFSGPYIGIENDFAYDDSEDNGPSVGKCIELPNKYLSICLDSLSLADTDYATYTFKYTNSADLDNAIGVTSAAAVELSTTASEGFVIDVSDIIANGTQNSDIKTNKIWLSTYDDIAHANATDLGIYYKDISDGKVYLAGFVSSGATGIELNYGNTKSSDMQIVIENDTAYSVFNLTVMPYDSTYLPTYQDNISMYWSTTSNLITSLGGTASSEEAGELEWEGTTYTTIGTKDENHRTMYGVIVKNPKSHGASDEVVLSIPKDQVFANIAIKGSASTTSTSGDSVTINKIPATVSVLDTEVASASAQNLIIVGGPAVNSLAASVAKVAVKDFIPNEAMIKLVDNGAKVALLVAGYEAVDTRNAADALASGKLALIKKADAVVKSTALSQYTVA